MDDVSKGVRVETSLTSEALDAFLDRLDPDRERAGAAYELLRRKLVSFFEWRGCAEPEDYADRALNRIAVKIAAGEEVRDVPAFCHGVARLMLLEAWRDQERARAIRERPVPPGPTSDELELDELRLACLESCLERFPTETRDLLLEYHRGEWHERVRARKQIAARLGIPPSALRIRMHRLRVTLERCIELCVERGPDACGEDDDRSPRDRTIGGARR